MKTSTASDIKTRGLLLAAAILFILPGAPRALAEEVAIGMMKVSLMPEYDAPSILVINEGKFVPKEAFPREAVFMLPAGVTKLTDACSLSPGGQHFCQLFDIESGTDRNTMKVKLPYPDFFIDYQYAPFTPKKDADREFGYRVESPYDIKNLTVVIQQPYRSERFKIEPAGGTEFEKEGYRYFKYVYTEVKKGEQKDFRVSYYKADEKPSVDTQYSPMAKSHLIEGYGSALLLAAGAAGVGAILYFRKRKQNGGETPS